MTRFKSFQNNQTKTPRSGKNKEANLYKLKLETRMLAQRHVLKVLKITPYNGFILTILNYSPYFDKSNTTHGSLTGTCVWIVFMELHGIQW